MLLRVVAIALVAGLAITSPTIAHEKKPYDPNKVICRSVEVTGSYFPQKVCHTAAEWRTLASNNDDGSAGLHQGRQGGTGSFH